MSPTRHVLTAMTGSVIIFLVAGGRAAQLQAKIKGEPDPGDEVAAFEAGTWVGWGVLLLIFIFITSIEAVAGLAVGFAWLIFLTIILLYGEKASKNVLGMLNQPVTVVQPATSAKKREA